MARTIMWTPAKLVLLKEGYAKATTGHYLTTDTFKLDLPPDKEPHELVIAYAKHLIDYLEIEFLTNPPREYPENREGEEP